METLIPPPVILLVEDSDDDAELITRLLTRIPVKVDRVETLQAALLALAINRSYALVMTDLNLPDARGMVAVNTLVNHHESVLVLTGDPMHDEFDAIKYGADDLVYKNDTFPALRRAVKVAIARAARRRTISPV